MRRGRKSCNGDDGRAGDRRGRGGRDDRVAERDPVVDGSPSTAAIARSVIQMDDERRRVLRQIAATDYSPEATRAKGPRMTAPPTQPARSDRKDP
jgi:hypothetical protein